MGSTIPAAVSFDLPRPARKGAVSVEEALARRRSHRTYEDRPLDVEAIGQLLWAAQGIVTRTGFRTAPSAGALYPLEIYAVLAEGVYRYDPRRHRLTRTIERDLRMELCRAALEQRSVADAPLVLVFAAVHSRIASEYGPTRGERYVHMEIGHAAQNVHLQAAALGLGSVPIGAFQDARVQKALGLPAEERPLYLVPVGYPR